jgi:hypothetical protein
VHPIFALGLLRQDIFNAIYTSLVFCEWLVSRFRHSTFPSDSTRSDRFIAEVLSFID